MYRVFIDGQEGTTGLRIYERLEKREDVEIIRIAPERRKEPESRKECMDKADITFLCLPDAAAVEAAGLADGLKTRVIDASTAHRTSDDWAYGFPELSEERFEKIRNSKRVANPGCHASGFIALAYPLVAGGIIGKDSLLSCFSITGYSGGGKKMIAEYENSERPAEFSSPRQYGLSQEHKHLKEMTLISGLDTPPVFSPIVCDFYSGMAVSVPLHAGILKNGMTKAKLADFFKSYYEGKKLISVREAKEGMLASNTLSGRDTMEIVISGNDERMTASSIFCNLGKGASGAAVECMNIMLGMDYTKGLEL